MHLLINITQTILTTHTTITKYVYIVLQSTSVANILDATAPVKRGKEREVPKVKKPSPLKKVGIR